MTLVRASLISFGLFFFFATAHADTAAERGLEIALEADRRDSGFNDYTANAKMILRNNNQSESRRFLKVNVLEVANQGDKSLIAFDRPRDIKGTCLLTYSYKYRDEDQWIYIPSLKRVKRISSSNRSGPFVGSEFAYEDLVGQEVEKYAYTWVKDDTASAVSSFIVERVPKYDGSGYSRQLVWYDQQEYRILKIEYYDRKNDLLKTYTASGYNQYLGRYWRPDEMHMVNHQTGKTTTLFWSNYEFATGLEPNDFTTASLKRNR